MNSRAGLKGRLDKIIWQIFSDLSEVNEPVRAHGEFAGIRVTVSIEPAVDSYLDSNALTDCQADILDVLRGIAPRRFTKPKIIDALSTAKKYHGESTISLALKHLAERGLIVRPRPRSRDGYAISQNS